MQITKNNRGGYVIDGQHDLTLTKRNRGFDVGGIEYSDIKNFHYQLNVHKRKFAVLRAVIKWLYL